MADPWALADFETALDRWIEREQPSIDVQFVVLEWVISRFDDPYEGMRREPDLLNLWYGVVRGTRVKDQAVVCSYFIEEHRRRVRCDNFATLSLPL